MAGRIRRSRDGGDSGGGEIDGTIAEIRKRFGDATLTQASSIQQPERIPTGVFMLDFATLGGIPRNRITKLTGNKHAGKSMLSDKIIASTQRLYPDERVVKIDIEGCIAWYERILDTTTGQVFTAEQIFRRKLPVEVVSYDETGRMVTRKVTHWFDNGKKQVFRVRTGNTSGDFTGNHRFLVYTRGGQHQWVRTDELEPGMWVCRPRKLDWSWPEGTQQEAEQARLIGYLIGDGHFGDNGVGFTNIDADAIEDVRTLCACMGVDLLRVDDRHFRIARKLNGDAYTRYEENPVRRLLRDVDLYGTTGADKFIPSEVMCGSRQAVSACLTGLYMTDGTVHANRPTLSLSTISLTVAEQVRHLWSRFGVIARIHSVPPRKDAHSKLYQITINGIDPLRDAARVLTLVGYKAVALHRWVMAEPGRGGQKPLGTYIPDYFLLTSRERAEARQEYVNTTGVYWEQITSVLSAGEVQTYDFTVEDTHNLVVNDMIVHNTHDPVWSGKLGVDNDALLVAQPETGEQALDMADALIHTKEVSLIVVDSLAQLVPAKEVEASAEDQFVGMQARMIGSFVRKAVNALLSERHRGHYITLLFINQFRSKIGGWSPTGDPLTEPGGKGLGFAYTLEITVKNKEGSGKDDMGIDTMMENDHSFAITKNKVNAGPRSGEFRLRRMPDPDLGLEEGDIDDAGTMLAYAKKFGAYSGGGSSWTLAFWDFEMKFKGQKDATQYLYENREDHWKLRNFLIASQAERLGMPAEFVERYYPE